ncbi:hypothetical protein [Streptococcus sobrinus]|uniref:hypothetical protein n=1 Tax=Streptococcus sobrinus TaxID=1310 RepID=UPI0002F24740|nr:hypothetical protein [Streptococcus sobrinus]AWN19379.1 ferredoxin reductase [Streptococcus sobrinus]
MKGHSKMLKIILILLAIGLVGCLITWGVIAYLGRSQALTVRSIENPSGDLYLIHLKKPKNMTWGPGSYAKVTLPEAEESGQKSRWLTLASNSDENEILLLTHKGSSSFKKHLTSLSVGSKVKISWIESSLKIKDKQTPLVCFASDVGIAALRPLALKQAGKREIVLNHLDKGVNVFDEEMKGLANQESLFTYDRSASLSQSKASLEKAVKKYGNRGTYLAAGQPDDVKAMKAFLADQGITADRIKSETFRGLK